MRPPFLAPARRTNYNKPVMNYADLAEKSLHGMALSKNECYAVLRTPPSEILELLGSAFKVREARFGRKVRIHLLVNAKSGLCSENCAYCSQSAVSRAPIDKYPMLDENRLLQGAWSAREARAARY